MTYKDRESDEFEVGRFNESEEMSRAQAGELLAENEDIYAHQISDKYGVEMLLTADPGDAWLRSNVLMEVRE